MTNFHFCPKSILKQELIPAKVFNGEPNKLKMPKISSKASELIFQGCNMQPNMLGD